MDLDIAYANSDFIPNGADYPKKWEKLATDHCATHKILRLDQDYGEEPANKFDLFLPEDAPKGVLIFVHGGYWMAFGRKDFSHLAAGALAQGWAVAMPSYTLAPTARISQITTEVATAIDVIADEVPGRVILAGHSAGGHLVARMNCSDVPLACANRLRHILSISPLGDLRPLMQTTMNEVLQLDAAEAAAESPCLNAKTRGVTTTVWVGGDERPAFLDQAQGLTMAWDEADLVIAPDRHHFDVIDDLIAPDSSMITRILAP